MTTAAIDRHTGGLLVTNRGAYFETWLAGSVNSHVPVVASGTAELLSADITDLDRDYSLIQVIVGGTGTCKLTISGSVDGVTLIHSLGDRITGMVVGTGSYILKLNDTSLAPFPLLHFLITETGGVNPVEVRARIIGRKI